MSSLAQVVGVGLLSLGIGYFIPRSRDVLNRVEPLPIDEGGSELDDVFSVFEEVFAALPVTALIVNAQQEIIHANPQATILFGRTHAQILGRALVEVTGSYEWEQLITEAQQGEEISRVLSYHSAQRHATLRVLVKQLRDQSILLVAFDETAIADAKRVRREFLGNISHELRTPLAGMKLMIETLNSDDEAQTRAYFFPRLAREIDRMVELVEHLLEVARSEAGQIRLQKQKLQLSSLVRETLEVLEPRLKKRGLSLVYELEDVVLEADPARLAQVAINFVENAMRHTPVGGVITVATRQEADEAVFEVRDTGAGIPYKDLPHLFERFYVVDRSRAKDRGGLGVGLAIVKRNIEAHGGQVSAASEFGHGSTFTARLPLNG